MGNAELQKVADQRVIMWTASVGLRFKFGKKPHIRNTRLIDYEAPYQTALYNELPLNEPTANNENTTTQVQAEDVEQLKNKLAQTNAALDNLTEEVKRIKDDVEALKKQLKTHMETFPPIAFESASTVLSSYAVLDEVVKLLNENLSVKILIIGHTDSTGSKKLNTALSLGRAEAVKKYMVEHGINANRITTKGEADTQPVASNSTLLGRQQNRRVEFYLFNNEIESATKKD
jgi:outer membrane protein OmpA-like peptidoglycan-associated protein